jgi:hypothetical protein
LNIVIVSWFLFASLFIIGGIAGGIPILATLTAVALLVGVAWYLRRRPNLGILVSDGELVVRSALREVRVLRKEIASFRIASPSTEGGFGNNAARYPVVQLIKHDGTILSLWVTATTPVSRKSQPTEKALVVLSEWLNAGRRLA